MLGGTFTLIRIVAAAVIALCVAYLMSFFFKKKEVLDVVEEEEKLTLKERRSKGVSFSLIELVDTTAPWMLLGIA